MKAEFDKRTNSVVVYNDEAKEWLDIVLESMSERMGWSFPEVIEEWLFEFVAEVGFRIDCLNPRNTLWCFDDSYVNQEWGHIDEREWSKEEAKELYEEGELLFFDEASGYYVERL